jgi:ribonuclease III
MSTAASTAEHPINMAAFDQQVAALAERLGYQFSDVSLLRRALAHRSWCAENKGADSNERLEFLGDAVLGWVVTDLLFNRYSDQPEGQLTNIRKALVNAQSLADIAADLDLGSALLLGRGEERSGGRARTSILCDAFEAVIGAVYLDGGTVAAVDFLTRFVGPRIEAAAAGDAFVDHKTLLQEVATRRFAHAPHYIITHEGPDHAKRFFADVTLSEVLVTRGEGASKKLAEQDAARKMLMEIARESAAAQ